MADKKAPRDYKQRDDKTIQNILKTITKMKHHWSISYTSRQAMVRPSAVSAKTSGGECLNRSYRKNLSFSSRSLLSIQGEGYPKK